ncbi:unnamed protein product, partial [Heterotrigona itama]
MSPVFAPLSTEGGHARNQAAAGAFCRMLARFLPPLSIDEEAAHRRVHCAAKKLRQWRCRNNGGRRAFQRNL